MAADKTTCHANVRESSTSRPVAFAVDVIFLAHATNTATFRPLRCVLPDSILLYSIETVVLVCTGAGITPAVSIIER